MAFISSMSAAPTPPPTTNTPRCETRPDIRRNLRRAAAAAALIVSVNLPLQNAIAFDDVLIFDHDQTLMGANFEKRTDLRGAIFSKANCKGASFLGADLTNAQLDDTNVRWSLATPSVHGLSLLDSLVVC